MTTNKEWLSTLSVEELLEWLTEKKTRMIVNGNEEWTRYGIMMYAFDSKSAMLQWLKDEHK
jgi:hypothetical protein